MTMIASGGGGGPRAILPKPASKPAPPQRSVGVAISRGAKPRPILPKPVAQRGVGRAIARAAPPPKPPAAPRPAALPQRSVGRAIVRGASKTIAPGTFHWPTLTGVGHGLSAQAHGTTSSGGLHLGIVTVPTGAIAHDVGNVGRFVSREAALTGKQALQLPKNLVEAAGTIGKTLVGTAVRDPTELVNPLQLGANVVGDFAGAHHDPLADLVVKTVQSDPVVRFVKTGNPHELTSQPLNTILDAAAAFGALGRAAGAAKGIGEASHAGEVVRGPVLPGYGATVERRLTRNALTAPLQHAVFKQLHKTEGPTGHIGRLYAGTQLRRMEAVARQGSRARLRADTEVLAKGASANARGRLLRSRTRLVAPDAATSSVISHAALWGNATGLPIRDALAVARQHFAGEASHYGGGGAYRTPAYRASAAEHVAAIDKALRGPLDERALQRTIDAYSEHPSILVNLARDFGLDTPPKPSLPREVRAATRQLGEEKGAITTTLPKPGMAHLASATKRGLLDDALRRDWASMLKRVGSPKLPDRGSAELYREHWGALSKKPSMIVPQGNGYRVIPVDSFNEFVNQIKHDYPARLTRAYMSVMRKWRGGVLATSPKLPVMHTVESTTRSALLSGVHVGQDYLLGKRSLNSPVLSAGERAYAKGTLAPGAQARLGDLQWQEQLNAAQRGSSLPARALGKASDYFDKTTGTIIHAQRALVKSSEYVSLGREARLQAQRLGSSWLEANRAAQQVADEFAKGLKDPVTVERLARRMQTTMGQYNSFTARTGNMLRYMPFMPWYMNAARLVFIGLPRDHPLVTSIALTMQRTQAPEWRREHAGYPSFTEPYLAEGKGKFLDVGKFTPVGVGFEGNPAAQIAGLVGGPLQSPALAGLGIGPFGQRYQPARLSDAQFKALIKKVGYSKALKYQSDWMKGAGVLSENGGDARRAAGMMLEAALEGFGGRLASNAYSKGGTLSNISQPAIRAITDAVTGGHGIGRIQVQPGTAGIKGSLANRIFNPFVPTNVTLPKAKSKKASGYLFGGGGRSSKYAY